jgi:hypothetical protein
VTVGKGDADEGGGEESSLRNDPKLLGFIDVDHGELSMAGIAPDLAFVLVRGKGLEDRHVVIGIVLERGKLVVSILAKGIGCRKCLCEESTELVTADWVAWSCE